MSSAPDRRFVVVPAFNEERTIGAVVAELRGTGMRVVVVDDGSSDGTAQAASEAGAEVLRHALNMGQGMALRTGMEFSLREGAEIVVTFDADGQHRVADVAALVAPVERGEADVALGSRFLGAAVAMPPLRRAALRMAAVWYRFVHRMPVTDTQNGLRAMNRKAVQAIPIRQPRMAHASELLERIPRAGLRWVEVPVTVVYSAESLRKGQSLWGVSNVLYDLVLRRFL